MRPGWNLSIRSPFTNVPRRDYRRIRRRGKKAKSNLDPEAATLSAPSPKLPTRLCTTYMAIGDGRLPIDDLHHAVVSRHQEVFARFKLAVRIFAAAYYLWRLPYRYDLVVFVVQSMQEPLVRFAETRQTETEAKPKFCLRLQFLLRASCIFLTGCPRLPAVVIGRFGIGHHFASRLQYAKRNYSTTK